MGHERLSSRACAHVAFEWMDGGPRRRKGSISLVLFRVHHFVRALWIFLVRQFLDWFSHPAGHEHGAARADGPDDDGSRAAGKRMASVLGFAAMPILLAPILGPVIAGAILQFASWRWLFLVNLPFGVLALLLAVLLLPNDREETKPRDLDLVGLALLSPGLVLFFYGSDHLRDGIGIVSLVGSILLLVAFFRWATRKKTRR